MEEKETFSFNKVLIANRGEIAVRIIRACRELGIKTVAIYSEADRDSLHMSIADEAYCIGPAVAKDSYLNIQNILAVCEMTGATAIHPGFGFLSENENFAKMCEKCNIKFIGPSYTSIALLGDKAQAKETMKSAGVPVIPGSDGEVNTIEDAIKIANEIKYPIMVKAAAGGGGRGIKLVSNEEELKTAFYASKQESKAYFGNDGVYIEKFIESPKHIEIQILADECGNVVHLGERDCSMQRRNQKVIEESPSIFLNDDLRAKMGNAAIKAAKATNYYSAGTCEFLVDKHGDFYFMEMNTRIQVEHPVTEMVTGIDIIKAQINIARGEKLEFNQEEINLRGHSIECRICAENPKKNFMPSPGEIIGLHMPGGNGVRVDSCAYQGWIIPKYYDSMIAKIIVHGKDRKEAIAKMRSALAECIIVGVETNTDFLMSLLREKTFVTGEYDTGTIAEILN
jgi:acetyl-CoA carboxylase biotin carboxylase subunit